MTRVLVTLLTAAVLLLGAPAYGQEVEGYADWQPQTRCSPKAKPGTKVLGRWIVAHRGGGFGGISRRCRSGGTSEHKEGRAFDWTLDATRRADRRRAGRFLAEVRATDDAGNTDAGARRMGIMYIIWNDHMYAAWDEFAKEDYLSSSCRRRKNCSKTLRHRDHMHISLSRPGGRGRTSWYDGRLD
jgi:hypothetical protein